MNLLVGNEDITIDKTIVWEKFSLLTKEQQSTVRRKAAKTSLFLNKENNLIRWKSWVKLVLTNMLYGLDVGYQIKYSRDNNLYHGKKRYFKMLHLDRSIKISDKELVYDAFIFITDALDLLDIMDNKIGNYNHENDEGYISRMQFSEKGRIIFNQLINKAIFEDLIEHDLLIKTDRIRRKVVKGKHKGKEKWHTFVVDYKDSVRTDSNKKLTKKFNNKYEKQIIIVRASGVPLKSIKFIDDL